MKIKVLLVIVMILTASALANAQNYSVIAETEFTPAPTTPSILSQVLQMQQIVKNQNDINIQREEILRRQRQNEQNRLERMVKRMKRIREDMARDIELKNKINEDVLYARIKIAFIEYSDEELLNFIWAQGNVLNKIQDNTLSRPEVIELENMTFNTMIEEYKNRTKR